MPKKKQFSNADRQKRISHSQSTPQIIYIKKVPFFIANLQKLIPLFLQLNN